MIEVKSTFKIDGTIEAKPASQPNEVIIKSQLDASTLAVGGGVSNEFIATVTGATEIITLPTSTFVSQVHIGYLFIPPSEYTQIGDSLEISPSGGIVTGNSITVLQARQLPLNVNKANKIIPDATYTLLEGDNELILIFTNNTGCVVTIPTGLTVNNRYEGKQRGDGQIEFVGDTGITVNPTSLTNAKTAGKFSPFVLDVFSATEVDLIGELELI